MDKFVEKYIKVEKNNLIAKTPLDIVIDKEEHTKLIDDGEYYILQGIVDIINPKQGEQWTSPFLFDISIPKTGSIDIAKKVIKLATTQRLIDDNTKDTPITVTLRAYAKENPKKITVIRKAVFIYPRADKLK